MTIHERRIKNAQKIWELWRDHHKEAMEYTAPNRETFDEFSPGQRKNRHIYDSTAVLGLGQFANRIQSSLIPPWVQWMDLTAGDDIPEDERDGNNQDLKKQTDKFFTELNHSNFYTEIAPALKDLGIGTGGILVEEQPFGFKNAIKFQNIPLAELYIEPGSVDNVWRKHKLKPSAILRTWPKAKLTAKLKKRVDDAKQGKDEEDIIIWNGQHFNADTEKYEHTVYYMEEKHVLFEQEFETKRMIAFRWSVTPSETYGRGPVMDILPDVKTANKMMEFILRNAAIQVSGIYTGRSNGVFNPHTVRLAPGAIVAVDDNSNQNPSIRAMTPSGNIQLGDALLDQVRQNIRKALFSDPLGDITDPVRTATENLIRQQEMLKDAGASFGRLKTELIEPLVAAVVDILSGLGRMAEIKVDGRDVTLQHQSPLAKSEKLEDFQNIQVWRNDLLQVMPPEILVATMKIEDYAKTTADMLGVTPELIRTEEERDEFAKAATEAAQAQPLGGSGGPV